MNKITKQLLQLIFISCISLISNSSFAQYRPSLFFREDFKEIPAACPITQAHIANPNLIMGMYGPGRDSIRKSNHEKPADDPFYVWSGLCKGNWAFTLKNKNAYADLSSFSKIKWRSKQAGFRNLYIILKLADGKWLISDQFAGPSNDWREFEFVISDIKWYSLDIKNVIEGRPVATPDLTKVDEIGFTDLMTGGGSFACSRLDWIEVYGKSVKR